MFLEPSRFEMREFQNHMMAFLMAEELGEETRVPNPTTLLSSVPETAAPAVLSGFRRLDQQERPSLRLTGCRCILWTLAVSV